MYAIFFALFYFLGASPLGIHPANTVNFSVIPCRTFVSAKTITVSLTKSMFCKNIIIRCPKHRIFCRIEEIFTSFLLNKIRRMSEYFSAQKSQIGPPKYVQLRKVLVVKILTTDVGGD